MKAKNPTAETPGLRTCLLREQPRTCELVSKDAVARIVRECLEQGTAVEIDGLGVFQPLACGECEFLAYTQPRVFIAYVEENYDSAQRLYNELSHRGFSPWVDKKKLLPGQNWPRAIQRAIEVSDFVLLLYSRRAASKRGGFQAELRYAMECARKLPLDEVFIIPARLEVCKVPAKLTQEIQYVDLFPDWDKGLRKIIATIKRQLKFARERNPVAA